MAPTLYFAYGSNLSLAQMRSRCPHSEYLALGRLKNRKWIIGERGYANIVEAEGQEVWGLVYRLDVLGADKRGDERDERSLDAAEGVPWAYERVWMEIDIFADGEGKGEMRECLVYVDGMRKGEGACREEYVHRMNRGIGDAVEKGMPVGYVEAVLRRFVRQG